MKKKIKAIYEWACVALVTLGLVSAPMFACQSAQKTLDEQRAYEEAIANRDEAKAIAIEQQANERQTKGVIEFALGWIPDVPPAVSGAISAAATPLVASLAFKRPREHYWKAIKGLGQSFVELNPIGSTVAPGKAAVDLVGAVRSVAAAWGLKHTTDDPDEVIANGVKLKSKLAAKEVEDSIREKKD